MRHRYLELVGGGGCPGYQGVLDLSHGIHRDALVDAAHVMLVAYGGLPGVLLSLKSVVSTSPR